jgi:hypothetical protein
LQGASLDGVKLQGASLYNAQAQGADFPRSVFNGTFIEGTFLWRTNFTDATFTAVSGNVSFAAMFGKDLQFDDDGDVDEWEEQPWTNDTFADLKQMIERLIPEGKMHNLALDRIGRLDPNRSVPEAKGTKEIEAARGNEVTYKHALEKQLLDLACSSDD